LQPDLLDFQRDFAAALDAPAQGPMAVYRNTVIHGSVEALRANYRVVEQIVGAEMFEAVAVDFATECPPRRPVLALYGGRFADWLEGQPGISDVPYLPDVARVERLCIESLMAADALPATGADIAREDLGRLKPSLHPALRFTWLSTPAMSIWLAHQRPIAAELTPDWKAEGALFSRPAWNVMHSPRIGPAAHRILFGIRLGESVGDAIAAASRLYPAEDCAALFTSLVNLGAFAAPAERMSHDH
jgi:hypothetical protein